MKKKFTWLNELKEYDEFLKIEEVTPPVPLQNIVRAEILGKLKNSVSLSRTTLSKLAFIHMASVAVTLAVCPQFGINPLKISGLTEIYMLMGHHFCMAACGATVTGLSMVFATLFLKVEELRSLQRKRYWIVPGLTFSVLGIFSVAGELVLFEFLILWIIGALLGGLGFLEMGAYFKKALTRSS